MVFELALTVPPAEVIGEPPKTPENRGILGGGSDPED